MTKVIIQQLFQKIKKQNLNKQVSTVMKIMQISLFLYMILYFFVNYYSYFIFLASPVLPTSVKNICRSWDEAQTNKKAKLRSRSNSPERENSKDEGGIKKESAYDTVDLCVLEPGDIFGAELLQGSEKCTL